VAASKTTLLELPIGPRYHGIILQHGFSAGTNTIAGAAANISDIRLKVNGRIQRQHSGTQRRDRKPARFKQQPGQSQQVAEHNTITTARNRQTPLNLRSLCHKQTLVKMIPYPFGARTS
jgi:hypothetical protein